MLGKQETGSQCELLLSCKYSMPRVTYSEGLHLDSFDWGFPLGLSLKQLHGLAIDNCSFCIVQVEDNTHCVIQ